MTAREALNFLASDLRDDSGPAISFDRVNLTLGTNRVLEDLDFRIEPGSIHCIIGPNGGGKTSLLRSLLGQMPHTGTISIDWPEERRIGYMPQVLDFDRTLPITVENFMAMICQNRPAFAGIGRRYRKRIDMALEAVGMLEKRTRQFGQLSGGERQRVLLAQSLIPMPGLLVLDEPMAGVDDAFIEIFESILHYLKERGITIFWIHHDLRQVRKMADAVTCINRRVLFTGSPEEHLTAERILDVFSSPA